MTDRNDEKRPPPVLSGAPDRALELKVKKHPEDKMRRSTWAATNQWMPRSLSTTQPGSSEPAPSSGSPRKNLGINSQSAEILG